MDGLRKNRTAICVGVAAVAVAVGSLYYYQSQYNRGEEEAIERTFAFIKPDAMSNSEAIKQKILEAGFTIVQSRRITLTTEQASLFYTEHSERPFFGELVTMMTSGPVLALLLERQNAVRRWRDLMGPTNPMTAKKEAPNSIRALFGIDITKNAVHGSDSETAAEREIGFFFDD